MENPVSILKRIYPFSVLEDADLKGIAPLFESVDFKADQPIYSSGDIPDFVYFLVSGEVKLILSEVDSESTIIKLNSGDLLGQEVLSSTEYRVHDAICTSDARLLRADNALIARLSQDFPSLHKAFKLLHRSFNLSNRLNLPWLSKDEQIHLISRRHPFFLLLRVVLIGGIGLIGGGVLLALAINPTGVSTGLLVFALFILLLSVFLSIWAGLEWTNDYFFITSERVLVQKRMVGFFDSRQESPYSAILSTGLESTIWGRMIGFGNIHLRSYSGDLAFKRLPFPEMIYELLEYHRYRTLRDTQQQDRSEIRETLQKRLDGKPGNHPRTLNANRPQITTTYTSGSFLDLLARFYGLRHEKSGSIVYRTHWWILLGKTLLPSLLLIGVVIFVILKWIGLTPSLTDTQAYGIALGIALVSWGWWLYQYLDWHNDIYIITPDQLVDVNRKPLGKEERRTAPIKNIQTVQFKRKGIIGLVLNYGTVRIQIGNEELTFDNVYDPAAIQAEIFAYFKHFNQRVHKMEQEKLADWIKTYDELRNGDTGAAQKTLKNR